MNYEILNASMYSFFLGYLFACALFWFTFSSKIKDLSEDLRFSNSMRDGWQDKCSDYSCRNLRLEDECERFRVRFNALEEKENDS